MPQLPDILGSWRDFYALLGTASATLIGLLFVAATVGAGTFTGTRRAAQRAFLSASVVNFSLLLAACLIMLAPLPGWIVLGGMILASGLCGLGYAGIVLRDTVRDGLIARIDLEDRTWYLAMPMVGYLTMAASGAALAVRPEAGCAGLALSSGLLLAVGIHNAWDITVWSITRRQG
jgi:hypothetical protein